MLIRGNRDRWSLIAVLIVALVILGLTEAKYKSKISIRNNRRLDEINQDTCEQDGSEYRLPRSVTPLHYNVTWRPDLEKLVFDGQVSILLRVNEPNSTTITIHQVDLTVDQVQWVANNKGNYG